MNFNLFDDSNGRILYNNNKVDFLKVNPNHHSHLENSSCNECMEDKTLPANSQKAPFPKHTPVGMAYVPFQQWNDTFDIDDGFNYGTLFPELRLPFERGGDI